MLLECVVPFGNFHPGDEVTVPDDVDVFDQVHFKVATPSVTATGEGGE